VDVVDEDGVHEENGHDQNEEDEEDRLHTSLKEKELTKERLFSSSSEPAISETATEALLGEVSTSLQDFIQWKKKNLRGVVVGELF